MARTVKPEEYEYKRREILNAAHHLVFTKGFEQTSIRDIQELLNISSGAFHHYFGSREALLEAYIDRIREEAEKPLLPIINDPQLTAIEKLQGFFNTLDSLRMANKNEVLKLLRIWYTDANALVRLKVEEAVIAQRTPLIAAIVSQGLQEGVFNTRYPEQTAQVILTLLQGMGTIHARLLLSLQPYQGGAVHVNETIEQIVAIHHSYMDAIERVLGAQANSLYRADLETTNAWVEAVRGDDLAIQ
jgi:TetR/AcrR family transcriptional regulator, transcriptional repressor for nem operon